MRPLIFGPILCPAPGLMGCQEPLDAVPETSAPEIGPTFLLGAALRPYYNLGGKSPQGAGIAFVIRDRFGRDLLLTAAHVMDDDPEWLSVREAYLKMMAGPLVAKSQGRSLHAGKAFSKADASKYLVIWPLMKGPKLTAMKLATADPRKNEWV
jgi:hypothetical protein